ncbi:HNH endonuclease [Brevibacterium sanguinis]|uniref:HNH endonuclease n=2 Tax=Brevibacterium TaxID=1696 RepID=A0A366IHN8_9MICO|nr:MULTISPECIES: HNH endonuclease signature motif containing protein [Brevibacterium]RBP65109.1 HNH endonuclease [Brevibacterium sanguinis]RBP71372.1 HNH endonuclease [Brevibacterium celere]
MSELAALTGTSITRAYGLVRTAITLVHGLPRFLERCLQGEFTIGHATIAARACQDLPLPLLAAVDDYLAVRRADTTFETFKKGLHLKVVTLQPISETIERTSVRRRVDFDSDGHGTGFLTLTGPAPELYACYRRVEAFARTIHAGNTSAFGTQLQPDERVDDPRGVAALMYDILSRTCPEVTVTVTRTNASTGAIRTSDISVGNLVGLSGSSGSAHGTASSAGTASAGTATIGTSDTVSSCAGSSSGDAIPAVFGTAAGSATANGSVFPRRTDQVRGLDHDAEPGEDISYDVRLTMPTHAQWLDAQARVTATVPVLTLLGRADLPGTLPDGSPIPADMARDLASHSSTWTRILTDPGTGTPIDAKASTYAIPRDVRRTLIAQWVTCTIPGCSRKAENTEIDHIEPFDYEDPGNGGLTRFGNLHCLCKAHHQAKTDRKFSVRSAGPLCLEYVFRHGTNVIVHAPDNPINAAQAHLFAALGLPAASESERDDSEAGISVHEDSEVENSQQQSAPAFPPIRPQYEFIKIPRQQIVGRFHYRGERRISAERPGPAPAEGRPGWAAGPPNPWSEYPDIRDLNPEPKEWYWDSGEPPPF